MKILRFLTRLTPPARFLLVFILLNLLIAALTLTHYGESWDEYNFFQYAEESLAAYPGLFQPGFERTFSDPTLRHYGSWFLMTCVLAARLFPQAYISDVAHFLTFALFQGGVLLMYVLARRWLSAWPALASALLYATQPVLYGHAFINARDIPFQVGFMASLYFGLRWSDSLPALPETKKVSYEKPRLPAFILILWGLGIAFLGYFALQLADSWLQAAPALADASGARELDLYLRPVLAKFWAGLIFLSLALAWSAVLVLPVNPSLRHKLWKNELRPYALQVKMALRSSAFWLASLALALTVGIRVMGGMAAVLVVAHALWRVRRAAFLPVFLYAIFAILLVIPTWPYLWGEPLLRLLITFRLMTSFPWPGQVLFAGKFYAGNELPRSYLPTLFGLQLTEPLLLLAVLGLLVVSWKVLRRDSAYAELLLLSLGWFGLPLGVALLGQSYFYDNFRQLLFILPPIFLWAGLGLETLFERLQRPVWKISLLILLVLPGVMAIFSLHPYPYIYYNSLPGGTLGAFRQYEMDYWGTSFREVALYLNQNAPQDAEVVVWGPPTTLWRYLRRDIRVYNAQETQKPSGPFYALLLTRNDADLRIYPRAAPLYQVEAGGALLAVLRFIEP